MPHIGIAKRWREGPGWRDTDRVDTLFDEDAPGGIDRAPSADASADGSRGGAPLAVRTRPRRLADFVGQSHLLGEDSPLRVAIEQGRPHSMVLYGPPGTGKTTLARIVAEHSQAAFEELSAVAGFFFAHVFEELGGGGIGLAEAVGEIGVDAAVFFFEGDGEGQDFTLGQIFEFTRHELSGLRRISLDSRHIRIAHWGAWGLRQNLPITDRHSPIIAPMKT